MTTAVFFTDSGTKVPAVTVQQMREIDRIAIEWNAPSLLQMMENAGRALAVTIMEMLGAGWRQQQVVVLAGTGGNGGGGICAARHLANHGGLVTAVTADPRTMRGAAAQQLAIYRHTRGQVATVEELSGINPELVVDAVIGYSLAGVPRGETLAMITWANTQHVPLVALDVPSGLDATTGVAPGSVVGADATVTLALPKVGLDAGLVGRLWLADIGIPVEVYRQAGIAVEHPIFDHRFRVLLAPRPG